MANEFVVRKGLIVSGSSSVTGSLSFMYGGITGSLFGTASLANNVLSSSFAATASAATSITFIPTSSSFSTTASYALNADVLEITGSAPQDPTAGDLWYDNTTGKTYIYYISASVAQWVLQSDPTYNPGPSIQNLQDVTEIGNSTDRQIIITNTTNATSTLTGALIVSGGLGVDKSIVATSITGSIRYSDIINTPSGLISSSTQINALSDVSSSFATTASAATSITFTPATASFAISASFAQKSISSSFANTSSAATSITFTPASASFANTSSAATSITFIPVTSSFSITSSFANTASAATSITFTPTTASFANTSSAATSITFIPTTSSFATTASAATSITFIPVSASFSTTSSAATSITFIPVTASFATTASYALNAQTGGSGAGFPFSGSAVITGSLLVSGSNPTLTIDGTITSSGDILVNNHTIGRGAGNEITNLAVGSGSLGNNTTGTYNTAIGTEALIKNTTGLGNVAIGAGALYENTIADYNTAVGAFALQYANDGYNVAIGPALSVSSSGTVSSNVAIGYEAIGFRDDRPLNIPIISNIAIGYQSMRRVVGTNNIALGEDSLSNISGSNNIALGVSAGISIVTGSNNTIIGNIAGTTNLSNTIILAAGSTERLRINSSGDTGLGTTNPQYKLHVSGAIFATDDVIAFSDKRVKKNVVPLNNALELVKQIEGVKFHRVEQNDADKQQIGFIAQQLQTVLPEVVIGDEKFGYGVTYGNITALLVEAIKEQQKQIDELKSQLVNKVC